MEPYLLNSPYYATNSNMLPEYTQEILEKINDINRQCLHIINHEAVRWQTNGESNEIFNFTTENSLHTNKIRDVIDSVLSCHVLTRVISKFYKTWLDCESIVTVCDGMFMLGFQHSWLSVHDEMGRNYIVDVLPIGSAFPTMRVGSRQLFSGRDIYIL